MKRLPHILLLVIIYAAFISLGLPDSVLGVAWPSMRQGWGQPIEAVAFITVTITICSAISSFASAWVLRKLGTGMVVLLSGGLTGGAILGFSFAPSFGWLIPLALPYGFGAGAVDAGLNHFVAEHYSSRHMNWLHGCWGVGATLGPIVMGAALAGAGWPIGYRQLAAAQLALTFIFLLSLPLWGREGAVPPKDQEDENRGGKGRAPVWTTWLAPFLYVVYAAVEVGTGLWAASVLVEGRGFSKPEAAFFVAVFFGAIMGGRFLSGLVSNKVGNRAMVRGGLVLAIGGAVIFSLAGSSWPACLAGLALLGLGCAPVYPGLMHETPRRFNSETARKVVGRQVAFANVGAALVPPAFGFLAHASIHAVIPGVAVAAVLLLGLSEILNRAT